MARRSATKTRSQATKPPPAAPPGDPHVAKALEYARGVVAGSISACKWVRLACKRHLDDLGRENFAYHFDEAAAGRACRYLEQLPHVKGPRRGSLLVLEPWQCFIIASVFGWKRANGLRRFRRAYIEVPRGNGKSFIMSGVGLLGLSADHEGGADVYSAATTTEQANITRGDADAMLTARPELERKLGLRRTTHAIFQPSTNSTFKALSRESKNQEGKNVHFGLVDELHAHPTREIWDVVIMGAAKRTQSIVWAITTAGTDVSGICYEIRDGVVKMLEGAANDQLFGIIYTIDDDDDWRLESGWIKANPNWHASIDQDLFRMDAMEATQTASKENNFKTKHLNVWCNADVAWMQISAWDACADPDLDVADFAKSPCVIGLDLASKTDLAARVRLFYRDLPIEKASEAQTTPVDGEDTAETDEGEATEEKPETERHFYLYVDTYLPEAAVEKSRNAQFEGWVKDGWIKTTPGNVLDFEAIKTDLAADQEQFDVREVAYDPWQATQLATQLQEQGFVMVEVKPTVQNFSEPMKTWEAEVLKRRFHHDGNPCMRWMVSNVVCHIDAKDNIYPRKQRAENKIDGAVATIMALNRALLAPPEPTGKSYLEENDLVVLG